MPEVRVDWSQSSQKRKMYRKKNYGVELISAVRLPGKIQETWRRTVSRESKIIGKSWNELKALAHNR